MPRRSTVAAVALATVAALAPLTPASGAAATTATAAAPAGPATRTVPTTVRPEGALRQSTASREQMADLDRRHREQRERIAAAQPAPAGAQVDAAERAKPVAQTEAAEISAQSLLIRRNNANTRASAVSSTLGETAAANDGSSVFYTGNTYASYSTNDGSTWTGVGLPAGPADAPNACCDQDVVRAHNTDRIFSILLYTNAALNNGGVRIFVRDNPASAPLCTYYIDPGGAADDVLPDYPHIGVSANALYLTTQNQRAGSWIGSQIRRFNLAQMSACTTATTNTLTHVGSVGQRVFTPVEGAQNSTTMYFGAIESNTSFRIFSWAESSTSVPQTVRTISASNFSNPDCRGGTGNFDFIERATSWTAAGFRMRGALHGSRVTWYWHSAPTGGITQGHVRAASFRTSDLTLVEQPHIWNASLCFGYPVVSGNVFGDLGISIAAGGAAGGGGAAAQGYVGVDDTPADPIAFGSVILTASGTHNRTDGRYGDYFTVRTNAKCQRTWVGTNYALSGGNTTSAHVNARYVEFGSTLDSGCF
ncbi:hypothetical protein [Micromonospora coxensis]|uniref:hypothetical protein n=1 Tax=Micromonospora coxensis TaxID=356852 RepID=UPI0012FE5F7F|nr:hypothetical protein [Micromonospora coxensis]